MLPGDPSLSPSLRRLRGGTVPLPSLERGAVERGRPLAALRGQQQGSGRAGGSAGRTLNSGGIRQIHRFAAGGVFQF